ncbi:hypothetical protein SLEP1_g15148 [Rubroshorea leprosula]|uniref:Uncharacterized protein n=1 Tax=Rubroshorea leprosula TaxID=152421 RepID=A0AAV5IY44_9ROSI|nr:hypothetical protein SLEP1_g15148 [Rubroshorea leprosula]
MTSPSQEHPESIEPEKSSPQNLGSDVPHDLQNPEPSETLTLQIPCPQNPQQDDDPDQIQIEEDPNTGDAEMPASIPPLVTDLQVKSSTASPRLGGGPKRKKKGLKRRGKEKNFSKKRKILDEILKPIPFVPPDLDFSRHEKLLKRLGLWDFVHLEFDRSLRTDLLAQLIASYGDRCSYVNGARINVSRADLARALKLPVKKDKDTVVEEEESEESKSFVQEFLSKWVILQGDEMDDMWIMPPEVSNWTKVIKEGHFEKLDWASLIWSMVEKELKSAPDLGNCYYASHLQCLIKCQKEELLREEPKMEVDNKEEEEEEEEGTGDVKMVDGEVKMVDGEVKMVDGDATMVDRDVTMVDGDVTMVDGVDESRGDPELEEHNIELSLGGQEKVKKDSVEIEQEVGRNDDIIDFGGSKELEPEQSVLDRKIEYGSDHILQRCSLGDVGEDCEEDGKKDLGGEIEEGGEDGQEDDEEEEEHEEVFTMSLKGEALDGITSSNLIEAMDAAQLTFRAGMQIRDNSLPDFLVSRVDTQSIPVGSSFLGNVNKRDIGHETGTSDHSLNGNNKRLRADSQWHEKQSDFYGVLQDAQQSLAKARVLYAEREQSYNELNMNQQLLLHELQERQRLIDQLQKARFEEQHKRQVEVFRLERELYMMGNLLDGYRKALKETHRNFAEYRARCPQPDEPLYKDVKGSGGLVLSTAELEKQRLKEEEEERINRLLLERKFKDFEAGWLAKFESHKDAVFSLDERLNIADKDVKQLKELANRRVSETPEHDPNEHDPNEPDQNEPDPNEPDPNEPNGNEPDANEPEGNEPDGNEPDPNES